MLEIFAISVFLGQLGAVWGEILSAPGFIFDGYIKMIGKLPKWLKNPLGFCSYCMIGQIALWLFIPIIGVDDYNVVYHVFFISNSIFFNDIFNKILRKW